MPQLEFSLWLMKLMMKWSLMTLMFISLKYSLPKNNLLIKEKKLKKKISYKWKW